MAVAPTTPTRAHAGTHAAPVLALNHTEHAYIAVEGLAGSMVITYMMQFNEAIEPARLRTVLRELVSAWPRFRGVVEAGLHSHRMRILPDNETTDQLFEIAWREDAHIDAGDPAQLERLHQQILNDVVPLEHGLLCRFRFVPHATSPVLFLSVHHILFDGRSALQFMTDLLARLNGGPRIPVQPLEAASHLGALAPSSLLQWPRQLLKSFQNRAREAKWHKGLHVQQAAPQGHPYLSIHMLRHHTLSVDTQALRRVARILDISVNSLVTLILCEAYLSYAPKDSLAAAVVRQSVDLRRFYPPAEGNKPRLLWGNHVGAFLVTEVGAKSLRERAASVKAQVDEGMARFERREMLWNQLPGMLMPVLGRTLLSHIVHGMQRKGRMPRISCHATSLGNVSKLNAPDAKLRMVKLCTAVPSVSTLHVVNELDGQVHLPVVWQRCDATVEQMDDYLRRVDEAAARIVHEGLALVGG
jgi:hypothetical protein